MLTRKILCFSPEASINHNRSRTQYNSPEGYKIRSQVQSPDTSVEKLNSLKVQKPAAPRHIDKLNAIIENMQNPSKTLWDSSPPGSKPGSVRRIAGSSFNNRHYRLSSTLVSHKRLQGAQVRRSQQKYEITEDSPGRMGIGSFEGSMTSSNFYLQNGQNSSMLPLVSPSSSQSKEGALRNFNMMNLGTGTPKRNANRAYIEESRAKSKF